MPTALGIVLIFLGLLISGSAIGGPPPARTRTSCRSIRQWLGWICILAGPLMFHHLRQLSVSFPQTFACVFVVGTGRTAPRPGKSALVLAAVITVFGVVVFLVSAADPDAIC